MSQVVAVTGASRGIGAAIALELARRGFTVGCLTRRGAGVEAGDAPPELAARFVNVVCDVNDEAAVKRAFATLVERTGACRGLDGGQGMAH